MRYSFPSEIGAGDDDVCRVEVFIEIHWGSFRLIIYNTTVLRGFSCISASFATQTHTTKEDGSPEGNADLSFIF